MPALLNSVPNHPWIGKLIFDNTKHSGLEFRGVIKEVSDNPKSDQVYVRIVYNDGETEYVYVKRNAIVDNGIIYI